MGKQSTCTTRVEDFHPRTRSIQKIPSFEWLFTKTISLQCISIFTSFRCRLRKDKPRNAKRTATTYANFRIPKDLADKIDKVIQSGKLGYGSRAELVNEPIRLRLELQRLNNSIEPSVKDTF